MLKLAKENKDPKQLFQLMEQIIKKPVADRIKEEIQILVLATKNFKFFKSLNEKPMNVKLKIHERCCARMKYEFHKKGSTVFFIGDLPEKFYIILLGSVNVLLLKTEDRMKKEIAELGKNSKSTIKESLGQAFQSEKNTKRTSLFQKLNKPKLE